MEIDSASSLAYLAYLCAMANAPRMTVELAEYPPTKGPDDQGRAHFVIDVKHAPGKNGFPICLATLGTMIASDLAVKQVLELDDAEQFMRMWSEVF
jgi:hypothetical protein